MAYVYLKIKTQLTALNSILFFVDYQEEAD